MSEAPVVGTGTLVSTLARKFAVDVNTGTTAAPVWTRVRAVNSLSPTIDATLQDDDDFDSDGWGSQTKTMQRWSLEIGVLRKVDIDTDAYDPGQEALRAAADQFGPDASVRVRWYDREGGPEAYSGVGTVSWAPGGGGVPDLDTATVTVNGQGARLAITNPVAPVTP